MTKRATPSATLTTRREPRLGFVLAIVSAGWMLATIDLFIVNIAFPTLQRSFHGTHLSTLSWVLNGYTIVFAALLVPAGRLADRTSLKRSFLVGVAVFTLGSALCAAANGVGLLLAAFPAERRLGAVRLLAAMGGLSAAAGPVLGGLLLSVDWRWIFLINLPIGVATLLVGSRLLPAPPPLEEPFPDLIGALLLMAAVALLTLGLVEAPDWGWSSASALGSLIGSVVLFTVFVARSARHPHPVVEHGLLRVRTFALSTLALLLFSTSFATLLLSILLWTQTVWGWSALRAGLAFAPGPLMVPLFSIGVGRLAPRVGAGTLGLLGCVSFAAAGIDWALAIGLHIDYAAAMLPGTLLTGIGVGLTLPTLTATATSSLPRDRFATGSAVINMARQIGFTLGVAVLVAVLRKPDTPGRDLAAYQHSWEVGAGLAFAAAVISALLIRRPQHTPAYELVTEPTR